MCNARVCENKDDTLKEQMKCLCMPMLGSLDRL